MQLSILYINTGWYTVSGAPQSISYIDVHNTLDYTNRQRDGRTGGRAGKGLERVRVRSCQGGRSHTLLGRGFDSRPNLKYLISRFASAPSEIVMPVQRINDQHYTQISTYFVVAIQVNSQLKQSCYAGHVIVCFSLPLPRGGGDQQQLLNGKTSSVYYCLYKYIHIYIYIYIIRTTSVLKDHPAYTAKYPSTACSLS